MATSLSGSSGTDLLKSVSILLYSLDIACLALAGQSLVEMQLSCLTSHKVLCVAVWKMPGTFMTGSAAVVLPSLTPLATYPFSRDKLYLHNILASVRLSRWLNMLVKSQKLACSLKSNLTFCTFSPREVYSQGSVKSAPHLRESCFFDGHFPPSIDSLH